MGVTRDGESKREAQKVKHILGKQVGTVPADLCRVFRTLLEKEMTLGPTQCHYGGHVGQSTNPHVHQSFKRALTRFGRYIAGGGANLRCSYMMQIKQSCFDDAVKIFKDRLSEDDMHKVLL